MFARYRTFIALAVVFIASVPPLLAYQPWHAVTAAPITQTTQAASIELAAVSPQAPLQLVIEPEDGTKTVSAEIQRAQKSIELVIYELEDPTIEQQLVDAQNRGVQVRVILQNVDSFGKYPNQAAYDFLQSHNVPVKWAARYFTLTHQKTLIVDGTEALIMTYNLSPQYYATSRDFGVVDDDATDVQAISNAFDSDWNGSQIAASDGHDLVWSPGSAPLIVALIQSASSTLDIYNEEMGDSRVTSALETAAERGVEVRVDMTYATNWKSAFNELTDEGVQVHTYASTASRYIHAKMILVDGKTAFLGSENFSGQSLDTNRELGLVLSRPDIISSLEQTFESDWTQSRVYSKK